MVNESQSSLFDATIQQRFEKFHCDNPRIYTLLVGYCRAAREANEKVGIRAVWERMRWHIYVETKTDDDFKFNDHYTSRYARLIMQQESDLADMFELRELRSA